VTTSKLSNFFWYIVTWAFLHRKGYFSLLEFSYTYVRAQSGHVMYTGFTFDPLCTHFCGRLRMGEWLPPSSNSHLDISGPFKFTVTCHRILMLFPCAKFYVHPCMTIDHDGIHTRRAGINALKVLNIPVHIGLSCLHYPASFCWLKTLIFLGFLALWSPLIGVTLWVVLYKLMDIIQYTIILTFHSMWLSQLNSR